MSPICKKSRPQKRRKTTHSRPVAYVSGEFCQKVGVDASCCSKNSRVDKTNPTLESFFRQQKEERQNELETLATRDLIQREALNNLSRVLRRRLEEAVSEYSEEILQSSRTASQRSSPHEASDTEERESNDNHSVPASPNVELLHENSDGAVNGALTDSNERSSGGQPLEQVSVWDSFFERQRLERRSEVDTLASVNHITRERSFLISSMLSERITTIADRDSTPARNELSALRNSHQVRNLLSDSFRQRLERLLSRRNNNSNPNGSNSTGQQTAPVSRRIGNSRSGTSSSRNGPPIPPPPPPIPAARRLPATVPHTRRQPPAQHIPPPPLAVPVGWDNFNQEPNTQQRNIIRNDRFDDLAEIGNLVGSQVVSRVLNSTFADILEQHLIHRMEGDPDTFSQEARREVQRTLDSLPRSRIVRNDFRDAGIDPDGLPRLPEDNPFDDGWGDEPAVVPVPTPTTRARGHATGAQMGEDRLMRLEAMMESMQNMITRQNTAQVQLENTLQQMVLNQSLMTASGNMNMVSERAGTCVVCLDETQEVNSAFYKCGHMVACNQCASILLAINPTCPLCRQPILDVIKLYRVEKSSHQ